jgi:hypothetical protein
MTSKTSPRAITTDDIVDLLRSITMMRVDDDRYSIEELMRPLTGVGTIRWVERWNQTNGTWRRGNPYAYHRWGYGEEL